MNDADRVWLGSTYTNKFYISNLQLDGDKGNVLFTVQVLYKSGVIQDINCCGKYDFTY